MTISLFFLLSCLPVGIVMFPSPDLQQKTIEAVKGSDVILPCKIKWNDSVEVVLLTREGISGPYVLFHRANKLETDHQDPSYVGRVNTTMADGEVSMVLKDVTDTDEGVYQCFVGTTNTEWVHVRNVTLAVKPAEVPDGNHGERQQNVDASVLIGIVLLLLLLLIAVTLYFLPFYIVKTVCGFFGHAAF
ncbi:uncharacterized protein LOC114467192 isoform X2 [Gouania willdenowi]|uniref:uncharacterized protein LOC114467192 isoform X2 n=1 Tax=Gouania willdenowi TaxID=441366 RepID=UPI001055989B|nr:uncharacterized protein LOC114467192 isoform X2 [Gouania willdenowi]